MRTFHVTLRYDLPDELIEKFNGNEVDALAHVIENCDDDGVVDFEEILPDETLPKPTPKVAVRGRIRAGGNQPVNPTYMGDKNIVATIGDVVMAPGNLRGIVIAVNGTFVTVLAIATKIDTGETFVLTPRFVHDFPAGDCSYLEKQTLTL